MNVIQKNILLLLKSAITGVAHEKLANFPLVSDEAKKVVKKHHLITLVYQGALNCGVSPDEPEMKRLFTAYYKHMVRSECQIKLADSVFDAFDKNGIDYLPTKGYNMKKLYPKPEMRLMGDVDVYIRSGQKQDILPVLQQLGLSEVDEDENTFTWGKDSFNIEFHKHMVSFYKKDYYDSTWEKVIPLQGNRYGFTTEDEFIHLFNHFARHYRGSGIGLRHVIDLYVFRLKNPQLDEDYIYQEMCVLKLQKFYKNILRLLNVWFENGESDPVTDCITDFIFNSGSWGDATSYVISKEVTRANRDGEVSHSKSKAIIKSVFPPVSYMSKIYPVVGKYKILLPFTWILRGVDVLRFRRKNIKLRTEAWKSVKDSTVSDYREQFKFVGLD